MDNKLLINAMSESHVDASTSSDHDTNGESYSDDILKGVAHAFQSALPDLAAVSKRFQARSAPRRQPSLYTYGREELAKLASGRVTLGGDQEITSKLDLSPTEDDDEDDVDIIGSSVITLDSSEVKDDTTKSAAFAVWTQSKITVRLPNQLIGLTPSYTT